LREGSDPEASWLLSRSALQEGDGASFSAALDESGHYGDEHPQQFEPAPFVGAARCAECHGEIHHLQQSGRHAKTFLSPSRLATLPLPSKPMNDPNDPKVVHTLQREQGGRPAMSTRTGGEVLHALIAYAVGSGDRGLTPIGRDDAGQFRELRLS